MVWRLVLLLVIVGAAVLLWRNPHVVAAGLVLLYRMAGGSTSPTP
ncbi:MAG TPA: hypothetical protein VIA06_12025 [Candidatus Dormibacteraeota bacterium]|jgi:hypothetical protein|nr:hypothetical protein [Candidatus Dormibacteraeota bacterium]